MHAWMDGWMDVCMYVCIGLRTQAAAPDCCSPRPPCYGPIGKGGRLVSMVVPVVLFVICSICVKLMCWDMPTAHNHDPAVIGNRQIPSMWDYVDVLLDVRGVVMIFQCYACFSTELAKNKHLVKHSRTYFRLDASDAKAWPMITNMTSAP